MDRPRDRLRVLLVGCGVMGARHAAVVAADPECELVVTDLHAERARAVADRHGARAVAAATEIDLAIVATPTSTHRAVAGALLDRGIWCLVEKPLADSADAARELARPRCAVGHSERYNPAVRAIGALGPLRPLRLHAARLAPPVARGMDVDVVLDLMIHDLDLLAQWTGLPTRVAARGDRDAVEVEVETEDGARATLVASRVAAEKRRSVRCEERDRLVELDLLAGRARCDGEELRPTDAGDALTCQWRAFRARAAADRPDPDPGLRAMGLADRIRRALGALG